MNAREREQYLREYSILKSQGKPFFPYAIMKDSVMAAITIGVIMLMAILFGAELGPKADPTTTTYTPRPEWYFFFLFELLRVVKPPALVFIATVGIPTLCLVLLLLLPFYDRGPERHPLRRPIAMTVPARFEKGKKVMAASGCLSCHKVGENGNTLGPNLTHIGDRLGKDAIERTLINPTPPMPAYTKLRTTKPQQFDQLVQFVASLRTQTAK